MNKKEYLNRNKLFAIKTILFVIAIFLLGLTLEKRKVRVFSIGDSTMANVNVEELSKKYGGDNFPQRGWMMMIPQFFNNDVVVQNAAIGGRSSKSFRDEGSWKKVIDEDKLPRLADVAVVPVAALIHAEEADVL